MSSKTEPKSDQEIIRPVHAERPGTAATEPAFDDIIEAILGADPKAIQADQKVRRDRKVPKP